MSADLYLGFAALFISYFLKVAVACLLCWLLAALVSTPRQRFILWLSFLLGSVTYWLYAVGVFSASTLLGTTSSSVLPVVANSSHQLLLPAKFQSTTLILGRILGAAYIVGVVLLAAVGIWKRIRLRMLLRQGAASSAALQNLFSQIRRSFRVHHCELLVLAGVNSPATVYWWRPRIVLPRTCEQLDDEVLIADVLSHELAHVSRRDYLWSSLSDIICGLLFFHPAVWQARKQMRIYREMACDSAVVASRPEHRADYAQTLTRVARLSLPRKYPLVGIDFAAAPSLLRYRVEAILNGPKKISPAKTLSRALACTTLVGAYGFFCFAMAFAIAFAPPAQPRTSLAPNSATTHATGAAAGKIRRAHSRPEAQQVIAESPAYRLPTNSDFRYYPGERSANFNASEPDSSTNSPGSFPTPASGRSPASVGKTVEAVIVSTVGTVIAGDKDDRSSKKK